MCYNREDCDNFTPSPLNKTVCLIHCSRNPEVAEVAFAHDWYNPTKGERVMKVITLREEGTSIKEARLTEEFDDVDKFINMMNEENKVKIVKSNMDLRESERKAIVEAEGELLQKPERPKEEAMTLDPKEVMVNIQQKMKEYEEKVISESVIEHDEEKIREKIQKIQKDLNREKKDVEECPYCGRSFKKLYAHLRFCKKKPIEKDGEE